MPGWDTARQVGKNLTSKNKTVIEGKRDKRNITRKIRQMNKMMKGHKKVIRTSTAYTPTPSQDDKMIEELMKGVVVAVLLTDIVDR